jgi:hypothetical protein
MSKEDLLDWLETADKCNLEMLMHSCAEWLVVKTLVSDS